MGEQRHARFKQSDISRAAKGMRQAGFDTFTVRIDPRGNIEIIAAENQPTSPICLHADGCSLPPAPSPIGKREGLETTRLLCHTKLPATNRREKDMEKEIQLTREIEAGAKIYIWTLVNKASVGDKHSVRYLDADKQRAEYYARLLKAALDLFEDGDLRTKYITACQDAGMESGL